MQATLLEKTPANARIALAVSMAIFCIMSYAQAIAQPARPMIQSRTVPSGEKRQLAFLTGVDCSVDGGMTVRIAKQARHGSVSVDRGIGYTSYGPGDFRIFCNLVPKEGYQVTYESKDKFRGEDQFEIEFFSPSGQYTLWRYAVSVR